MIVNKYNQGGGSGSGVTPQEVQQQIDSALTPYWESAQTESAITQAVSGLASEEYVQEALSGVNLENYYTSAQTEEAITSKNYVTSADVKTQVEAYGYATTGQVNSAFTYINEIEQVTASGYTELHDGLMEVSGRTQPDMSLYTPTSGFSTINGSAITNGGNLVIQGGGGGDMSAYWNSAETKSYVDGRIDGGMGEVPIGISQNPWKISITGNDYYEILFCEVPNGWMGPVFTFYEPEWPAGMSGAAPDIVIATLDNSVLREDDVTVYYAKGIQYNGQWETIHSGFTGTDVLTTSNLGPDYTYYVADDGEGYVEFNVTNFPDTYPQYFVYNRITEQGYFTNTLPTVTAIIPGVEDEISALTQSLNAVSARTLNTYTKNQTYTKTEIDNKHYVTSAQVETQISDMGFLTSADTSNFMDSTDAQVISTALNDLNTNKVAGSGITSIEKIEQTAYNTLVSQSATTPTTFYVIVPDSN